MDEGASPTSSRSSSCWRCATPFGMTQDDIDAVIDGFTPDGSDSAFGD